MTPAQAAAFVHSQTVCALAEIEAMRAENRMREIAGLSPAHGPEHFRMVPDQFQIGHNCVVTTLMNAKD